MAAVVPVLLIIWLGGLLASRTAGGLLHALPLLAVALAVFLLLRKWQERGASTEADGS